MDEPARLPNAANDPLRLVVVAVLANDGSGRVAIAIGDLLDDLFPPDDVGSTVPGASGVDYHGELVDNLRRLLAGTIDEIHYYLGAGGATTIFRHQPSGPAATNRPRGAVPYDAADRPTRAREEARLRRNRRARSRDRTAIDVSGEVQRAPRAAMNASVPALRSATIRTARGRCATISLGDVIDVQRTATGAVYTLFVRAIFSLSDGPMFCGDTEHGIDTGARSANVVRVVARASASVNAAPGARSWTP